jgi:hypothetical protein
MPNAGFSSRVYKGLASKFTFRAIKHSIALRASALFLLAAFLLLWGVSFNPRSASAGPASNTVSSSASVPEWRSTSPLPVRSGPYRGTVFDEANDRVYLVASREGRDALDHPTKAVYLGRIQSDLSIQWSRTTDLPLAIRNNAAVMYGGKLYSFGGDLSTNNSYVKHAYEGTLNASGEVTSWTRRSDMDLPSVSGRGIAFEHQNRLYYMDGQNNQVLRFDNGWVNAGSFPARYLLTNDSVIDDFAATVANNRLYLSGGQSGVYGSLRCQLEYMQMAAFKPNGDLADWQQLPIHPDGYLDAGGDDIDFWGLKAYHYLVEDNGYLYVIGGSSANWTDGCPLPKTLRSDGTFVSGASMRTYRAKLNNDGTFGSWELYGPGENADINTTFNGIPAPRKWDNLAYVTNGFGFHVGGSFVRDSKVFVVGGMNYGGWTNSVAYLDLTADTTPQLSLEATVGLRNGASASNGVNFVVYKYLDGQWLALRNIHKDYDGQLLSFSVPLDAYINNDEIGFLIGADASGNYAQDWAIWTSAKLVRGDWEYDLIEHAPEANWHSSQGACAWGGCEDVTKGLVTYIDNQIAEDGKVYPRMLYTHPDWVNDGFMHGGYNISISPITPPTPLPPTATPLPPTVTLPPPTSTPAPPTATAWPPTPTPLPSEDVTLNPVADTYVSAEQPGQNYGTQPLLEIDNHPASLIAYLKFDLASITLSRIESAILRLRVNTADGAGSLTTQNLRVVADHAWGETTMTYNNRLALGTILAEIPGAGVGEWIEIDLTSHIQGTAANIVSLAIDANGGDGLRLKSKENVADQPELVITLSQPDPIFVDVPTDHWANYDIEILFNQGYLVGCNAEPRMYCPENTMARVEAAVFVVRGVHGASHMPIEPAETNFADVPPGTWYAKWVEQLWLDDFTAGCGVDNLNNPIFCPLIPHSRAEAAVFFLRMCNGSDYTPPSPSVQAYDDIPIDSGAPWYSKWVVQAYQEGITAECEDDLNRGDNLYRPEDEILRSEAACMMVRALGLE